MKTAYKNTSSWVSLTPTRAEPTLGRLFCLPFAGGGTTAYCRWPGHILAGVEVARIQLPGREIRLREPLFDDLGLLVDRLADELIVHIDGPFVMYGHSMGALMAFELARVLRRRSGFLPAHLFVAGYRAPQLPPSEPPFSHLPDAEFIERVRNFGGLPDAIVQEKELLEIFLPILRADFRMTETYVYNEESPLECPITAFGGLSDPKTGPEKILAWNVHTSARFDTHFFPGGHFFLLDSESSVLDEINLRLSESLTAH